MMRMGRAARAAGWAAAGALTAAALTGVAMASADDRPVGAPGWARSDWSGNAWGAKPGASAWAPGHSGTLPRQDPRRGRPEDAMGTLLHSQSVVQQADGSFVASIRQTGTVVGAKAKWVRVVSVDEFEATYRIAATTRIMRDGVWVSARSLRAGDVIEVCATIDREYALASQITAMSPEYAAAHANDDADESDDEYGDDSDDDEDGGYGSRGGYGQRGEYSAPMRGGRAVA